MSKDSLTVSQRLALRKWVHSLDTQTPSIPRAATWAKDEFGKDVSDIEIRKILERPHQDWGENVDRFHAWDDAQVGRLVRPGFGAKVSVMPEDKFPSAVLQWAAATLTYSELAMMWFIESITNKPEWHLKVFNEEIVAKWEVEVMKVDWEDVGLRHAYFSHDMFAYCVKELRDKARLYEATCLIPVFDASAAVVKSDSAVPADVKERLRKEVAVLENIPEEDKDWHPGSNNQVLDLVHPSLWPLAYGVSRILPTERVPLQDATRFCAAGEVIPEPREELLSLWSKRFQWLPCDVELDNGKPRIVSYINNLHPRHGALYSEIENVMEKALPLLDLVYRWPEDFDHQRLKVDRVGVHCLDPEVCPGCEPDCRPQESDEPEREDDDYNDIARSYKLDEIELEDVEEDDAFDWETTDEPQEEIWRRDVKWFLENHTSIRPTPSAYKTTLTTDHVNLKDGFFNNVERFQVIVKLANIHLTPDSPTYDGGSWHIEGQLNEHICATALYYYDNDNITDSHLAFRTTADREQLCLALDYNQDDYSSIGRTFAIEPRGNVQQNLGSVLTREGRLIAFPNVYQHRVAPFELADKSLPGHRKILALFLVDPAIPIISTANVPPQQKDWWTAEAIAGRLPPELVEMVVDNMGTPFGVEKAKEMRLEVMKERTTIGDMTMEKLSFDTWNFCEH